MPKYRKKADVLDVEGPLRQTTDVMTPDGLVRAEIKDYIVTDSVGARRVHKPHAFQTTYELAE